MSHHRLRLPLSELGRAHSRSGHAWLWECWVGTCVADRTRKQPQLTRKAAEQCLIDHLRDYHGATGGEHRDAKRPPPGKDGGRLDGVSG